MANPDKLYSNFERLDRTYPHRYENDLIAHQQPVFSAFIESKVIRGNTMKLFIPVFHNESEMIEKVCGKWEKDSALDKKENAKVSQAFYTHCYQKYHRIYLNDSLYHFDFVKYEHPYKNTPGILTYLSTEQLSRGKNVIKVEKISDDPEQVFRTMNIPFWFEEATSSKER